MQKEFNKKSEIVIAILLITLALGVGNYIYTFNGFIAYTQSERRACALLELLDAKPREEISNVWESELSAENKRLVKDYIPSFKAAYKHCKDFQQFYVEEVGLLIFSLIAIAFWYKNKRNAE